MPKQMEKLKPTNDATRGDARRRDVTAETAAKVSVNLPVEQKEEQQGGGYGKTEQG